jgi:paraquat-inducible protein A
MGNIAAQAGAVSGFVMLTLSAYLRTRDTSRSAALALAAALMLVPANLLPVLSTNTGGVARTDTILSGIVGLWNDGMWGISAIVFIASILIPLLKLAGLACLLLVVRRRVVRRPRALTRLYTTLDFIGRWSMLDVFLVGFLAGTVRFGALATIEPRLGILAFAAAVVLTVLATEAFDPTLLWVETDSPAATEGAAP